ncbi:MAG: type II toxin-antitoxin system Phd/YefM family antitoxin [Hormoscilla sp. GUM202]|nr:type II toxin-antitoxin system Phd/YefM family antitoxin [Hormoscilla sp. GUM202]
MKDEGFTRITTAAVRSNLLEVTTEVMVQGTRFVLQEAGTDVGAIVPDREFEKLCNLMGKLKPSQYSPEEEAYYEDDIAIHCMYPDEIVAAFDDIIAAVRYENEVFGILPIENMGGQEVDIFMPEAIVMSCDRFWVPEYLFVK